MTLAIILGVTTIPLHGLILRRRPSDLGLLPDGEPILVGEVAEKPKRSGFTVRDALRDRAFWVLTLAYGSAALSIIGLRVHLVPMLIERGFEPAFAAGLTGLIGAMQVVGRVIFAPLEGRLGVRTLTAAIFLLESLGILVLILITSQVGVFIFVVAAGAAYGAATLARASLMAEMFGVTHYGRITSIMGLFLTGATTIAPAGAGILRTNFGSYDVVLQVLLGISLIALVAIWFLPKRDMVPDYA